MNKKLKKLTLNAETMRNLDEPEVKKAAGGIFITDHTVPCTECTARCSVCAC